jgi:hypothetical protein
MRLANLKLGLGMALGLTLSACNLNDVKAADDETQKPATEATVIGIWRTDIPLATTPPSNIKVTMQVDAEHTMLTSQRVATGQPAPYDFVEFNKEYWTWKVVDGKVLSEKTVCEYKDPATMQPTGETACRAPLTKEAAINVKGSVWTVVEDGQPILFRKD